MAVVKGDAYGHGAIEVAEVLIAAGADWLGVASVDEGCQLRAAEIKAPVLILSPAPSWALQTVLECNLNLTVTSVSQIKDLQWSASRMGKRGQVNVKVDTGMHRLGASEKDLPSLLEEIDHSANLDLVSIFTHLAKAGDEDATKRQNETFQRCLRIARGARKQPSLVHMASSEATRFFPFTHYDMVRVGIYLYGLEARTVSDRLLPSMSVRGRINHVQDIAAGESAGYNYTWTASSDARLGSIPIGYADGVDRGLSNRMHGLLMGKMVKQVGLISMDQMLFDITDVPEAQEGDVITLIGSEPGKSSVTGDRRKVKARGVNSSPVLYLADWAQELDTITYELACRLRVRMPRVYTRHRDFSGL